MNKKEATKIIEKELSDYKSKSYSELSEMVGDSPVMKEITAESGAEYQIEVIAYWDSKQGGDIRVLGSIDDMALSEYDPLLSSFIMSPGDDIINKS